MKKIYLSILSIALVSGVSAQVGGDEGVSKRNDERVKPILTISNSPSSEAVQSYNTKATYLTEDFEGVFPPAGWAVQSGPASTTTDPLQDWHKEDNGGYPQNMDPFNGTNPGGNAAVLYINSVDVHDEWLVTPTMALPAGACRISFDFATTIYWHATTLGGTYDNGDISVQVSTDGGMTWGPIVWQEDSIALLDASYSNGYETYTWKRAFVDLSAYSGQSVVIGFHYTGLDAGPFYLDNVSVEDVPANDIEVLKAWSGDIVLDFDYSMVPDEQIKPLRVGTVVRNLGGQPQTFDVTADISFSAASVYTGVQNITLPVAAVDTLWFDTNYTPTALGDYTVSFTLPNDDENLNNSKSVVIATTDYTYAHDFTVNGIFRFDQDETVSMGNQFYMENNAVLKAADIKFETGTTPDLYVAITVWEVVTDIQSMTFVDQIDYTVPAAVIGNGLFTTVEFLNPINLNAGSSYVLDVQKVDANSDRMFLGGSDAGDDDNSTVCYGPFGTGSAVNFYNGWGFSPGIRMNFNPVLTVNEIDNAIGMSVYPNPAVDNVNLTFNIENASEVLISVSDLTGKIVYSNDLENVEAGINEVSINTSLMQNGIYMIDISVDGVVSTEKVVIKK